MYVIILCYTKADDERFLIFLLVAKEWKASRKMISDVKCLNACASLPFATIVKG